MVDLRKELRKKLSEAEFDPFEVRIKQGPKLRLTELFTHVRYARDERTRRIFFGGCDLLKPRFGLGFKLKFRDELHGFPVILYVDQRHLASYRFRRSLLDVVDAADQYTYLTVFAWSVVRWNETRQQYEVDLKSLKHLALYPGKRKSAAGGEGTFNAVSGSL